MRLEILRLSGWIIRKLGVILLTVLSSTGGSFSGSLETRVESVRGLQYEYGVASTVFDNEQTSRP